MENRRGWSGLATAALLLSVATACSNTSDGNPGTSPAPTVSSPSVTATPPSDNDVATAAATQTVRDYYAVRDQLRQDPTRPLKQLTTVAISTELSAQENLFKRERRDGLHQTGDTKIADLIVQSVSLDNSDPKAGRVPVVQIDVCFDVSKVDIVDKNDSSVVIKNRPDRGWIRFSVANYKWNVEPAGAWRVASSEDVERTPCTAS